MRIISQCPACNSTRFTPYLTCRDYTVSHETFSLSRCSQCTLVITSPQPDAERLPAYYESDDYISHSIHPRNLFDRLYRMARNYNLAWKIRLVKRYLSGSSNRILDIGCGTGEFLRLAQKHGMTVSGVEPSPLARAHAQKLTSAEITPQLKRSDDTFHAITLWHVLEHLPDVNQHLQEIRCSLAQTGTIFIAVPNHQSLDAKSYRETWAGYDVPRHLWHFDRKSMQQLLSANALSLKAIIPMKLDALYVSMLSEQYRAGRKNLFTILKGLGTGIRSNASAGKTNEYSSLIYVAAKR